MPKKVLTFWFISLLTIKNLSKNEEYIKISIIVCIILSSKKTIRSELISSY